MTNPTDLALVEATRRGDSRAFEKLIDRYQKPLFATALGMLTDREDASDVTQTAFIKAFEKLDSFDGERKFFSWIYAILVNEARNQLRRRRRIEPLEEEPVAGQRTPEEELHAKRLRRSVESALELLSAEHREVIVMKHYGELSYREISLTLGVAEKRVKSRLFEARRRLVAIMNGKGVSL